MMNDQSGKRILKDSIFYIPAKFFPAITGLIAIPILTRVLGTEEYGIYSLMRTTILLLNTFSVVWLVNATVRFHSRAEVSGESDEVNTVIIISLLVSIIIGGLSYFVIASYLFQDRLLVFIGLGLLMGLIFVTEAAGYLRATQQSIAFSIFNSLRAAGGFGLALVFMWLTDFSLRGFFSGEALFYLILIISFIVATKIKVNFRFNKSLLKEMLRFGLPVAATSVLALLLVSADQYMITFFRGTVEVGLYAVPYTIADQAVRFIIQIMIFAGTPVIFRIFDRKGEMHALSLIVEVTKYFVVIVTPIIVLLKVFDVKILNLVATPSYRETGIVMTFVAVGAFMHGITQLLNNIFLMKQKTRVIMQNFFFALLLNIIINLVLIPGWGYKGAAVATLISYLFLMLITYFQARRVVRLEVPNKVIWSLLLSVSLILFIIIAGYFITDLVLYFTALISIVIYVSVLVRIGIIKIDDLKRV